MKKYFRFDSEPITGYDYLWRVFFGSVLSVLLIGIWILAATGYKRAGAFGWQKEFRVLSAIFVPLVGIANVLAKDKGYVNSGINLLDIFAGVGLIFHLVLLFKDGNKLVEKK